MPARVFLARRPNVKEDDLEEIELWVPEKEGAEESEISEEEDGQGPSP